MSPDQEPPQSKRCGRCKEEKPRSEFWRHPRAASGLQSYCKVCLTEWGREYRRRGAAKAGRRKKWTKVEVRKKRAPKPDRLTKPNSDVPPMKREVDPALAAKPTKWCWGPCKRELPRASFWKDSWSDDGLQGWCRECNGAASRRWRRERAKGGAEGVAKRAAERKRAKEHKERGKDWPSKPGI